MLKPGTAKPWLSIWSFRSQFPVYPFPPRSVKEVSRDYEGLKWSRGPSQHPSKALDEVKFWDGRFWLTLAKEGISNNQEAQNKQTNKKTGQVARAKEMGGTEATGWRTTDVKVNRAHVVTQPKSGAGVDLWSTHLTLLVGFRVGKPMVSFREMPLPFSTTPECKHPEQNSSDFNVHVHQAPGNLLKMQILAGCGGARL